MKKILAAFQFLTIIPIRISGELSGKDISGSSVFFPLVGFFQGVLLAALSFVSLKFFSPGVTAGLIILAYMLTNGGFHMDGLSDTFDALSVKSSGNPEKDRQKRLAVMRDPTAGPIGITAIAISILLKYVLLKEVLEAPGQFFFSPVVFLMPVVSAWSMTLMMPGAKSARGDGLGKTFFDGVKKRHALMAGILLVFACCAVYLFSGRLTYGDERCFFSFFLIALVPVLCACYGLGRLCTATFGGLTGDNLGAIHEVSEITFLMTAVLWL